MSQRDRAAASEAPELVPLEGWGRLRTVPAERLRSEDLERITERATLTRGLGRAYGDAALPARPGARVADATRADRLLAFDEETGLLRAEAGLSLRALNRLTLPRRWFVPVTPGTQFVTLGGMVAADVHGKNHHRRGTFGRHVTRLRMRTGDGALRECSEDADKDLFHATQGGMGLTGHVLEVDVHMERLPSPWIWQELRRCGDLESLILALREASRHWPYTLAWSDGFARGRHFGRGVLFLGRWAEPDEARPRAPRPKPHVAVPLDAPNALLNRGTMHLFDALVWRATREGTGLVHPESFFYPLDVIGGWNRLYGRRGFIQYQCVVPDGTDFAAVRRLCETAPDMGLRSFLTSVKDFGPAGSGHLSFPRPGLTLCFDLPWVGERVQAYVDRMNEQVLALGGRVYLAKDALTRAEHLRAMEPRLDEWSRVRARFDPERRIRSALSVRLLGDAAPDAERRAGPA